MRIFVRCSTLVESPITPKLLYELKTGYPRLRHLRIRPEYRGFFLLDGSSLAAVLQCNPQSGYIVALEVVPERRGVGLARALLQAARKRFGCSKLTVNKSNRPAVSLYLSDGYTPVAETDTQYFMEWRPR